MAIPAIIAWGVVALVPFVAGCFKKKEEISDSNLKSSPESWENRLYFNKKLCDRSVAPNVLPKQVILKSEAIQKEYSRLEGLVGESNSYFFNFWNPSPPPDPSKPVPATDEATEDRFLRIMNTAGFESRVSELDPALKVLYLYSTDQPCGKNFGVYDNLISVFYFLKMYRDLPQTEAALQKKELTCIIGVGSYLSKHLEEEGVSHPKASAEKPHLHLKILTPKNVVSLSNEPEVQAGFSDEIGNTPTEKVLNGLKRLNPHLVNPEDGLFVPSVCYIDSPPVPSFTAKKHKPEKKRGKR